MNQFVEQKTSELRSAEEAIIKLKTESERLASQLKEQNEQVKQSETERDQLKVELEAEIQYLLDDKDRAQQRHMVSNQLSSFLCILRCFSH